MPDNSRSKRRAGRGVVAECLKFVVHRAKLIKTQKSRWHNKANRVELSCLKMAVVLPVVLAVRPAVRPAVRSGSRRHRLLNNFGIFCFSWAESEPQCNCCQLHLAGPFLLSALSLSHSLSPSLFGWHKKHISLFSFNYGQSFALAC